MSGDTGGEDGAGEVVLLLGLAGDAAAAPTAVAAVSLGLGIEDQYDETSVTKSIVGGAVLCGRDLGFVRGSGPF